MTSYKQLLNKSMRTVFVEPISWFKTDKVGVPFIFEKMNHTQK